MKKFNQSPYKFVLNSLILALTVAFFMFFINYTKVDNIRYITFLEYLSSILIGVGISALYVIAYTLTQSYRYVYLFDDRLVVERFGKERIVFLDQIKSIDYFKGAVYKAVKAVKIRIETQDFCFSFFIEQKHFDDFASAFSGSLINNNITNKLNAKPYLSFVAEVIRATFVFEVICLVLLPGIFQMLQQKDYYLIWRVVIVIYLIILCSLTIVFIVKLLLYKNINYLFGTSGLTVNSGKYLKRSYNVTFENISAVVLVSSMFSRLFNLYKFKLITAGGGKGLTETDYFPFMLPKASAQIILNTLVGEKEIIADKTRNTFFSALPTIVLWLIPSIGIEAVSYLGSSLLRLLYLPVVLFVLVTYLKNKHAVTNKFFIKQKGFINTICYYIPLNKIQRAESLQTITARITKLNFIEIHLSGYRSVIFGGYFNLSDFDNLVKKLNELG